MRRRPGFAIVHEERTRHRRRRHVTSRCVCRRRRRPSVRWGIATRRFRREHPARRRLAGSVKLKPRRTAIERGERAGARVPLASVSPFLRCRSFAADHGRRRFYGLRARWSVKSAAILEDDVAVTTSAIRAILPRDNAPNDVPGVRRVRRDSARIFRVDFARDTIRRQFFVAVRRNNNGGESSRFRSLRCSCRYLYNQPGGTRLRDIMSVE